QGADVVALIATPTEDKMYAKYKQYNWKVVQELKMPGAGNLFVKTHPKSKNFWADAPMNPEREIAESVYVFDMNDLNAPPRQLNVEDVHRLGDFPFGVHRRVRSEEHTSELQSRENLVCRLLLEQ